MTHRAAQTADTLGRKFGRLTVLTCEMVRWPRKTDPNLRVMWATCHCDCGVVTGTRASYLVAGTVASCGCIRRAAQTTPRPPEPPIPEDVRLLRLRWKGIRDRCRDVTDPHYGGKGITVEWANAADFIRWSLENGFRPALSIDRIDSNGPYAPWNCRWISRSENSSRALTDYWARLRETRESS